MGILFCPFLYNSANSTAPSYARLLAWDSLADSGHLLYKAYLRARGQLAYARLLLTPHLLHTYTVAPFPWTFSLSSRARAHDMHALCRLLLRSCRRRLLLTGLRSLQTSRAFHTCMPKVLGCYST